MTATALVIGIALAGLGAGSGEPVLVLPGIAIAASGVAFERGLRKTPTRLREDSEPNRKDTP